MFQVLLGGMPSVAFGGTASRHVAEALSGQTCSGGELMILVKCTYCDQFDDDGKTCTLLATELGRPITTESNDGEEVGWESVTWFNNTEELLPIRPNPYQKLGLVPHPHGTTPVVIADKHGMSGMWGSSLMLLFTMYNMQVDVSDCVGKIYLVGVVGAEWQRSPER